MDPQPPVLPPPADAPAPRQRRWGLLDFLVGLVGGMALSVLASALWYSITGDEDLDLAGQAFSQVGLWTGFVGAALVASRRKGAGTLAEDFGFRARWVDLGIGLAAALAVQLLLLPALAFVLRPLLGEPDVSGRAQELVDEATGLAVVGLYLSVVVGAPLVEELFFRGLYLRSLQRWVPSWLAVTVSSVTFGMAHASAMPVEAVLLVMISLTLFGAVLATLAVRTGRLGPSIVAHSVFNLFTLVVLTFT